MDKLLRCGDTIVLLSLTLVILSKEYRQNALWLKEFRKFSSDCLHVRYECRDISRVTSSNKQLVGIDTEPHKKKKTTFFYLKILILSLHCGKMIYEVIPPPQRAIYGRCLMRFRDKEEIR